MSAFGSGELGDVVRRSSTPAANEKVLLYLESLPRQSEYLSPTSPAPSEFRRMTTNGWGTNEPGDSQSSYGEVNGVNGHAMGDGWDLNMQEGRTSGLGGAILIHSTGLPEPGPNDPPRPHYESYGSSFGNMGLLPPHVLNTPPRSSRLTSSAEDDAATIIHEELSPIIKPPETPPISARNVTNGGDRPLSSRSHLSISRSQKSRSTIKSFPKSPSAQTLKSISSRAEIKQGSPLNNNHLQVPSFFQGPHYSHLQNGSHIRSTSGGDRTPRKSPQSVSAELNQTETQLIKDVIASRRSSYALPPSASEQEVVDSHFHDMDLCILLHQMDDPHTHEVVKKVLRKAIRQRVKKLGLKYDAASIKQYRHSYHNHDPGVHLQPNYQPDAHHEMPEWAKVLITGINLAHERFDGLDQKIDRLKLRTRGYPYDETRYTEDDHYAPETPQTQTVNINTAQPTGYTMAESMFPGQGEHYEDDDMYTRGIATTQGGAARTHGLLSEFSRDGGESPGQQYLEEELYKLRQRPGGSQSATHKTWELGEATRDGHDDDDDLGDEAPGDFTESGLPEIPDVGTERREASLPPIPEDEPEDDVASPRSQLWVGERYEKTAEELIPPWQRIHQRILSWAVIWPLSEIENALNSTYRGHQVNEIALSIWSTQSYKRYVRSKITDSPGGRPDRLFVPPNLADAISTAVFNGLHGDASGMLRDLWAPFGLEGSPRLIIVLAKHRSDVNHWVVHRFCLSDGTLTTYDTYPERTLPDGRPLGWWFSIRLAWLGAVQQNPDRITQKLVRLHRPIQLGVDNSVAAGGIWRNILMGSRAERSLDLERLRDLINTEVKNLRQRKIQGKLSLSSMAQPKWEEMG